VGQDHGPICVSGRGMRKAAVGLGNEAKTKKADEMVRNSAADQEMCFYFIIMPATKWPVITLMNISLNLTHR